RSGLVKRIQPPVAESLRPGTLATARQSADAQALTIGSERANHGTKGPAGAQCDLRQFVTHRFEIARPRLPRNPVFHLGITARPQEWFAALMEQLDRRAIRQDFALGAADEAFHHFEFVLGERSAMPAV